MCRVPATAIEALVIKSVRDHLKPSEPIDDRSLVHTHVTRVEVQSDQLVIYLAEAPKTKAGGSEDLLLKIGIHEGPCLAVRLNNSQDYFGQTVNIAARVQGLASSRAIFVTQPVVEDPNAAKILQSQSLRPSMRRAALREIADETTVYEIP